MHEDKLEAAISRGARADALMREEGGGWRQFDDHCERQPAR